MPRGEKLLKIWRDWSAGIGYMRDDGRTPGMYYASGLLGSVNELRAAPFMNSVDHSGVRADTDWITRWFFDDNMSATQSHVYAVLEDIVSADSSVVKIRTDKTNFGTVVEEHASAGTSFHKPARYQGVWYIATLALMHKLTTIVAGAGDTWNTNATGAGGHLMMINHQLAQTTDTSGVRILAEDGSPLTGTWGSFFHVGDKTEIIMDVFSIQGLVFLVRRSGLYSFGIKNDRTVSGMISEDFGRWRTQLDRVPGALWKSGAVIPHQSGLLFYTPGEPFEPIGIEIRPELSGLPPSGVTELKFGRYHAVAAVGDYIYTILQTDPNSTTGIMLCGYAPGATPDNIAWQVLGDVTLKDATDSESTHGAFVHTVGFPENTNETMPTLWFPNAAPGTTHFSYVILDSRGQPFRTRTHTHKVVTSGNIWMSLLEFDEPTPLSRIVIYTDDMASGDEWQLSAVTDDTGTDIKIGAPIIGAGRHERLIQRHNVYQFALHVQFTGTSTASRVPPSIKRIELFGPEQQ